MPFNKRGVIEVVEINIDDVKRILMGETLATIAKKYNTHPLDVSNSLLKHCANVNANLINTMPEYGYVVASKHDLKVHKQIYNVSKKLTYRSNVLDWLRTHRSEFYSDLPEGSSLVLERFNRNKILVNDVLNGKSFTEVGTIFGITKSRAHQLFHETCRKVISSALAVDKNKVDVLCSSKNLEWFRMHKKYIMYSLKKI